MRQFTSPIKLLFVDDEPSIRMTLPPVLQKSGFEVRVAESVSDALFEINSRPFDVLISDLNIGEEGDGFLVTSAMRHVQPECVTFILTGFPAFETALQAIHNHVDDYLVKPVDIQVLVKTLHDKIENRKNLAGGRQPLAELLKRNAEQIVGGLSESQGGHNPRENSQRKPLAKLADRSTDLKRSMPGFLDEVIRQLESGEDRINGPALRAAAEEGKKWLKAGYSPSAIARGFWSLEQQVYRMIQEDMGSLELGPLISDLRRFTSGLHTLMEKSLEAYGDSTPVKVKRKASV